MKIIKQIYEMQEVSRFYMREKRSVGLVPTMGALHKGHISLIKKSISENDITIVTIFVNPIQFNDKKDLEEYPKNLDEDFAICEREGVDVVFYPDLKDIYGEGYATYVIVEGLDKYLCGATRPGHFRGVCTIVAKLFNITLPVRAYFGEKDFQQLRHIEKMRDDLNFPIEIIACSSVHEDNGLAISSRNRLLSKRGIQIATSLNRILKNCRKKLEKEFTEHFAGSLYDREFILSLIKTNLKDLDKNLDSEIETIRIKLEKEAIKELLDSGIEKVDYFNIVDTEYLVPLKVKNLKYNIMIASAVYIEGIRLIDNELIKK